MICNLINSFKQNIASVELAFDQPKSFIVLVPGIAQIAQLFQIEKVKSEVNWSDDWDSFSFKGHDKINVINKAHMLGALARIIGWISLSLFTGYHALSLLALPALYQFTATFGIFAAHVQRGVNGVPKTISYTPSDFT